MGLDITIVKHLGMTSRGYLDIGSISEEHANGYSSDRMAIRHKISENVRFKVLESGKPMDPSAYYRPEDFNEVYAWISGLELEKDRDYLTGLFQTLEKDDNYWLDYGY